MKEIKALQKWVLNSQTEQFQDMIDYTFFTYTYYNQLDQTFFVHVLYIKGHEDNTTFYNCESYQQIPYNKKR